MVNLPQADGRATAPIGNERYKEVRNGDEFHQVHLAGVSNRNGFMCVIDGDRETGCINPMPERKVQLA